MLVDRQISSGNRLFREGQCPSDSDVGHASIGSDRYIQMMCVLSLDLSAEKRNLRLLVADIASERL